MQNGWMVRASKGGRLIGEFEQHSCVAIGWNSLGDLSSYSDKDALLSAYQQQHPDQPKGKIANAVSMLYRFGNEIQQGDLVLSYDSGQRCYLVGKDLGQYQHLQDGPFIGHYANQRKVQWLGKVPRDSLSQASRNSLSATLSLFALSAVVISELESLLSTDLQQIDQPGQGQLF